ncbi:(p)ppGpp synthetase [bacterium]|nr:MAG: (p)ppGpp synthetase [bacterium]
MTTFKAYTFDINMKESILDNYKKNKKNYHAYRERIINLLTDLLSTENMVVHQLVGRTKSLESLSKKIDDKNGKYNSVDDITDIVGIRIITYLESDINSIAELVEKEFIKDEENSVDKRKLQADRFGYKSLHVVVSLNNDRTNLKEYKRYKDFKCEIQIRSILQHAWAEIEHDLGYKGEISIPEQYRRSFNRVSALLETADIEFDRLKSELHNYEKNVPELIKLKAEIVDINSASINSFLVTNSVLIEATNIIEQKVGSKLKENDGSNYIIKLIKHFGFLTIGDFEKSLEENKNQYLKFVKFYAEDLKNGPPLNTSPLLYFTHYLAGKSQNVDIVNNYVKVLFSNDDLASLSRFVNKYIDLYKKTIS